MRMIVGAIAITVFAALSACGEAEHQRTSFADGKVAEGHEAPSSRKDIETPEWVSSEYRRLSGDEIADVLNRAKLLSDVDERTTAILKTGNSYEMKSFGNRMNGGIASHGSWVIEGDALVPEQAGHDALILFVEREDESVSSSEKIFGFFDKSEVPELSPFAVTLIEPIP